MPFRPSINAVINIDGVDYRFTEHPAARGMPYGQAGRRATVYQLQDRQGQYHALKVFTQAFRTPLLEQNAYRLKSFAHLPGLQVCSRSVINNQNSPTLLQQYADLEYDVLMPWVDGQTWQEIMLSRQNLTPQQSLALANSLVAILAFMEHNGIAHCDLSGPNVLIHGLAPFSTAERITVALVDVEDLYAASLQQPAKLPGGSAGYGHKTASQGLWSANADRFAGAILLAEMLAWCDNRIRQVAVGEQYFGLTELQNNCDRYRVLLTGIKENWGERISSLLEQAWYSQTLNYCPVFDEWRQALFSLQQQASLAQELSANTSVGSVGPVVRWRNMSTGTNPSVEDTSTRLNALLNIADALISQGNTTGAMDVLHQAKEIASPAQLTVINQKIAELNSRQLFFAPPNGAQTPSFFSSAPATNAFQIEADFTEAVRLYGVGDFRQAKIVFSRVYTQNPEFSRDGASVTFWLNECEKRISKKARASSFWVIGAIAAAGACLILAIFGFIGFSLFNSSAPTMPQPAPQSYETATSHPNLKIEVPTNTNIPATNTPVVTIAPTSIPTPTHKPVLIQPTKSSQSSQAKISNEVFYAAIRKSPGYSNKTDSSDIVAEVPKGDIVQVLGGPKKADGLNWWQVSWNGTTGWMADHTGSGKTLMIFLP